MYPDPILAPSPSPEPEPTPDPTPEPTPESTPTPTGEPTPEPNPEGEPTPKPTPEGEPTPKPTPEGEPTPEPEKEPEPTVLKPEDYKLPEGAPKELGKFAAMNKLSQEQLDRGVNFFQAYFTAMDLAKRKSWQKQGEEVVKTWGESADINRSLSKRALQQSDPKGDFTKILVDQGLIDHPAVINHFLELGQSLREGGFLKSEKRGKPGQKSFAQAFYPDLPSKEL